MLPEDVRKLDVQKLHTESLQLRNQQFLLATLSFAGSGVTAWIAPTLTAALSGVVPQSALIGATLFWLLLLSILYMWSLSLRSMISVISQYLDVSQASQWEGHYRTFTELTKGELHMQTSFTARIFAVYGVIATFGGFIAAFAAPDKVKLSVCGVLVLLAFLLLYLGLVFTQYRNRNQNTKVREAWQKVFDLNRTDAA